MPIYEYRCLSCKRAFSFLVGVVADSGEPMCPRCGGKKLRKLISRVARIIKSREAALEGLADPSQIGDPEDPKAMARWMRKMGKVLGDEAGEDFEGELDEMTEGSVEGGRDADDE